MSIKQNKVRLIDIANALSISPATVSLAINNKGGVRDEVRERVLQVCQELGYPVSSKMPGRTPSRLIRLCIYKKHGQIVCDTPFFSALIEGIESEARQRKYELIISYFNESQESTEQLSTLLNGEDVAGCILLATEMEEEDLLPLADTKSPLVILDNVFKRTRIDADYVLIDNVCGTYDSTEYLIASGHKKIGYLKSRCEINNFRERQKGYHLALENFGIPFERKFEFVLGPTFDHAYADMLHHLDSGCTLPTALVADNDLIAFGAMRALRDRGVRMPEDLSIVGFDDMPNSTLIEPRLTTVCVGKGAMGRAAVRQLIRAIEDQELNLQDCSAIVRMKTKLTIRDSVIPLGELG